MNFQFTGKRVLVTGGAQGLGYTIVKKFYESGAKVIALDINSKLLEKLRQEFPNVTTICADIADWEKLKSVVQECGKLDHLVNNAGIGLADNILKISEQNIDRTFGINFKGPFNLCQIFAKNVIANSTKDATIVNISSPADRVPLPGLATYCCSKAALKMMTKCFAVDLGMHGIRVNAIGPGTMSTALLASVPQEPMLDIIKRQPISGNVDIEDVANLTLYLSSPHSKHITGTFIPIDNGILSA